MGFGSVWLDVDWEQTDLRLGSEWAEFYKSLKSVPRSSANPVDCIDEFKRAVVAVYGVGKRFEQVRFIAAFCQSSKGFDHAAVHYPRVTEHLTPEGEAFEWFVKNEQESNRERGLKLSLPDLAESQPQSFPIIPIDSEDQNRRQNRDR